MSAAGTPLTIGTRGSALAMWQARHVAERLRRLDPSSPVAIVTLETEGDRIADLPLSAVPGKAFFTKEIERALLDGEIDAAVHSLKDLATEPPAGLSVGAVLERDDPRDVLVSRGGAGFDDLPAGARVGTSSLRRRALVARRRPDLELADLRGNVPTRLDKLDAGRYDAIVLAAAGLRRLGLEDRVTEYLPLETFLPAVAQGAIAVQIRSDDGAAHDRVGPLDHATTRLAVTAERALLRRLEGGCQVPVGALAAVHGGRLELAASIVSLDGRRAVDGRRQSGDEAGDEAADALGRALAEELLERGGEAILAGIRGRAEAAR